MIYPERIEPLVRLIEVSEPNQIVAAICEELRKGTPISDVLLASSLAVTRSCDLPRVHHGGSVHVISAVHAVRHMAERLPKGHHFLPVVQNVALSNKHIHSLDTGPYILAEPARPKADPSVERILEVLEKPIKVGAYNACDQHFLRLLQKLSPIEVLDHLLLRAAIPKNKLDDHNLLFPAFTWRVADFLGWEYGRYLVRPAIRFVTRPPGPPESSDLDELIDRYGLQGRELRCASNDDETETIAELGIEIGETNSFAATSVMLAHALAHGLSLEGAGEALSIGASLLFLRWRTRRAMDVHLNIVSNIQRYLIRCAHLPVATKLRALLVWQTGPDVRMSLHHLTDILDVVEQATSAPPRAQPALLHDMEALFCKAVETAPRDEAGGEDAAWDGFDELMFLAYQYASCRHEAEPLLRLLARFVCRDESSEMHTYEHHQAMYEEIQTTRPTLRWVHLVAAVKGVALSVGSEDKIFRTSSTLLAIQS